MRENWEDLANAVVLQAVIDYRSARGRLRSLSEEAKDREKIRAARKRIREVERFLKSGWFELLTDVDGRTLLLKLKEEQERRPRMKRRKKDGETDGEGDRQGDGDEAGRRMGRESGRETGRRTGREDKDCIREKDI